MLFHHKKHILQIIRKTKFTKVKFKVNKSECFYFHEFNIESATYNNFSKNCGSVLNN